MLLTVVSRSQSLPSAVVAKLIGAELLSPAEVVEQGVGLRDVSRRSSCFVVHVGNAPRWFVKVATSQRREAVQREVAAYAALREALPTSEWFLDPAWVDPDGALLVLPHVENDGDRPGPTTGAATGRALAELHAVLPTGQVTLQPPWVLDLDAPPLAFVDGLSPAEVQLLRAVQGSEPLIAALNAIACRWGGDSLVHGDLRASNTLRRATACDDIVLIDWEDGGLSDPAWDLAALTADLISAWLSTVRPVDSGPGSIVDALSEAKTEFEATRDHVNALVGSYVAAAGRAGTATVARSVSMLPALLVQRAIEGNGGYLRPSGTSVLALQLAENLVAGRTDAREFLGW